MQNSARSLISAVAASLTCMALVGCASLGEQVVVVTGKSASRPHITMDATIAVKACDSATVPPGIDIETCQFSDAMTGQTRTSSINLAGLGASDEMDPIPVIMIQVPADASNFLGTFDNGSGRVGTLVFTPGNTQLALDAGTTLVAEPGMQLVIVEMPATLSMAMDMAAPKALAGNYFMVLSYDASSARIKAISSGKLLTGNTAFYPVLIPCVTSMSGVPEIPVPQSPNATPINVGSIQAAYTPCTGKTYNYAGAAAATLTVVEYYNPTLDHFFITWVPAEIANLDARLTPTPWIRTNKTFKAFVAGTAGTSDICRFYIPPILGDSHFFGRGTVECDATGVAHPTFVLEEPRFMGMILPTAGVCPAGTIPVYRVFDNRTDANHRYTIDPLVRDSMIALGWIAEGDGPDLVVMCAPA